jgi:tetratricopeptide (TPR) repeat protein
MQVLLDNFKYLFQLYYRPARAMGNIMDNGSWLFGAIAVIIASFAFQWGINSRLQATYGVPIFNFETYSTWRGNINPPPALSDEEFAEAQYNEAYQNYQRAMRERRQLPLVGDYGLYFFSFNSTNFLGMLASLAVFYVPATILLLTFFEPIGSFGLVLRRDYGATLACTLAAWAAAHLPFALVGLALVNNPAVDGSVFLGLWLVSGLLFGVFMLFALRTVFGASWAGAIGAVALSWLSISLGGRIFNFISPYLFSPFLLIFAYFLLRGEAATLSGAFQQRKNFRRFLNNATLNPHDAEAHVQLGLLYKQRRQLDEALKHFNRAVEIDAQEIDANYELGKIARENGDLPEALKRFSIVVEQNEKHALNEIWREIGATYLDAKAYNEAREFLEKFVERRPFDPEGLYLLGQTLKEQGENDKAREMFQRCIEAVQTSPDYRRGHQRKWLGLAQKQLKTA